MRNKPRIIIIGGGLSGLTLAYLLSKRNIAAVIPEASARLGGRIQTVRGTLQTPLELGAAWFSDMHPNVLALVEELGLKKYPQFSKGTSLFQTKSFEPPQKFFVPEAEKPSYRLAGGTQMLIDALAQRLPDDAILLKTKVTAISDAGNRILLETNTGKTLEADKAILCLPPQLVSGIAFSPPLPEVCNALLPTVQTWMAGSIKFALEYDRPFWRDAGYSGMLYSHAGIITEMYDHTNFEENKFGFSGFLNSGAASYPQEVRREFALRQLQDLLGERASKPAAYFDKIWADEFILGGNQGGIQRPHQNNGHLLLQESYLDGKLFFAATETATAFSGYMEGAVIAAQSMAEKLS